jgi:hypothetical protein
MSKMSNKALVEWDTGTAEKFNRPNKVRKESRMKEFKDPNVVLNYDEVAINYATPWWEDRTTIQELADFLQPLFGTELCADMLPPQDISWYLRDQETRLYWMHRDMRELPARIVEAQDKADEAFAAAQAASAAIEVDLEDGMPDHFMIEAKVECKKLWNKAKKLQAEVGYMEYYLEHLPQIILDTEAATDRAEWRKNQPEEYFKTEADKEEAKQEWNFHWAQAKRYWQHVLAWLVDNGESRMSDAKAKMLFRSLDHKLARKEISSWYYYAISMEVVRIRNNRQPHAIWEQELDRLTRYAAGCKARAEADGNTWGTPIPKEYEPMEMEYTFMSDRCNLSEDEMIHAIDERGAFRNKYRN